MFRIRLSYRDIEELMMIRKKLTVLLFNDRSFSLCFDWGIYTQEKIKFVIVGGLMKLILSWLIKKGVFIVINMEIPQTFI